VDALPEQAKVALRRDGLDPVAALGSSGPVTPVRLPLGLRGWLVTGYDEVRAVLADVDTFSNDFGHLVGRGHIGQEQNPGGLGFTDPPYHTRLRRLLTPEFTSRRLARLAPLIDGIVADRLDAMAAAADQDGRVDLWQHFALPVPWLTICELLGVPDGDREALRLLSGDRFDVGGGAGASLGAVSDSLEHLRDLVARQRATPGPGLLGALVVEHGAELDDLELAGLADGILTGGLETTASTLVLGTLVLLQDDHALDSLRHGGDNHRTIVAELLRYLSVVQVAFPRFAREACSVGGQAVATGDVVLCSLSAANRDPSQGENLDNFDPTRPTRSHLAFGHGVHRCVGAELARMELEAALPALARRFPQLRLAVAPGEVRFRPLSVVFGLEALPVLLGPSMG
jgi:cytochrome P450